MIILSLSSWLVESKKWQVLVGGLYALRFRESVIQNLTAQAASFITPLRAGEIVFKVLFYQNELRKEIAGRTIVGNMSQMLVTTLLGLAGGFFILKDELTSVIFVFFVAILLFILILVFVLWAWKKYQLQTLCKKLVVHVASLSFLRYVLFAANWVLILWVLDYEMTVFKIITSVMAMYFLISVIPLMPVADIPVRLTAAAMVFEESTVLGETILFATLLVWCVNTILPTLAGCVLLPFVPFKTGDS
jgi:hypothetical protein